MPETKIEPSFSSGVSTPEATGFDFFRILFTPESTVTRCGSVRNKLAHFPWPRPRKLCFSAALVHAMAVAAGTLPGDLPLGEFGKEFVRILKQKLASLVLVSLFQDDLALL